MRHHFISAFAAFLTLLASPLAAQEFPELSGRVVDQADIIPDDVELALTTKLAALEEQSQRQMVVVTLADLQGYEIGDYGYQLGRHWGIGDTERNDGILLIVAPNDRVSRIEVGYGLEPIITDGLSWEIVDQIMIPRFKQGDYPGGISAGTDALIAQLALPEEEARAIATQAGAVPQPARSSGAKLDFPTIIFLALFFLFIVLPMLRGARGKKYRGRGNGTLTGSGVGDIILWEVGSAVLRGAAGGGSSGGGGFGGGGGFSGGGGSFGGGGASGGW